MNNYSVATVLVQSVKTHTNDGRLEDILKVISSIDADLFVFPGGYFSAGKQEAHTIYGKIESEIKSKTNGVVCVGVDGRVQQPWAKDQTSVAISKKGIIACARKFYPAPAEKGLVELADGPHVLEQDKPRTFVFDGKKHYLAVCYDSFGIRHEKLNKNGVNVVVNNIHEFWPIGKGNSGAVYFAKHGLAGASKQWSCPVFAGAAFINRRIPENWPSGVMWNQGNKSTALWKYTDNIIKPTKNYDFAVNEGKIRINLYEL